VRGTNQHLQLQQGLAPEQQQQQQQLHHQQQQQGQVLVLVVCRKSKSCWMTWTG
jgi:hypothetical protein